jgi:hypothetical protein
VLGAIEGPGMLPFCVVVSAHLCLSARYLDAAQRDTIFPRAHDVLPRQIDARVAQRLGVRIDVVESDEISYWRAGALNSICFETGCLFYRATCDRTTRDCRYVVGELTLEPTLSPPRKVLFTEEFRIHYETDTALLAVGNAFFLVAGGNAKKHYVRLNELRISPAADDPICSRKSRELGC